MRQENDTKEALMKKLKIVSVVVFLFIVVTGGYFWMLHQQKFPSTTDAYIEGNSIYISPQVSGKVSSVKVKSYQKVSKGELLLSIDPKPYELALAQAKSQYDIVKAQINQAETAKKTAILQAVESQNRLRSAQSTYQRINRLYHKNLDSKQKKEDAFYALNEAKAQYQGRQSSILAAQNNIVLAQAKLKQAAVSIKQAQLNLSYTQIFATEVGYLDKVTLRPSAFVSVGQKLFPMVENKHIWVVANFKETELTRIKVGQKAQIKVDLYPDTQFKGVVESISPASGVNFSLIPPQNATGNWVQVTQRFPIRIKVIMDAKRAQQTPLRLGASSTVTINTQTNTP